MSEFIDFFVKFSNFMSPEVRLLTPFSVPRGGFLYTMTVPGGGFQVVSRGMAMDEIDTCIIQIFFYSTKKWPLKYSARKIGIYRCIYCI